VQHPTHTFFSGNFFKNNLMEFLGIGIPEALFFILILLIVLGPADMVKVGHSLGTNLRKLWKSPTWRMIFSTSNTLRNLPNALAREAGMDEIRQELRRETEVIKKMGRDITESVQVNVTGKGLPPTPDLQASEHAPVAENDFSAWTTPPDEETHSIAPPARTKASAPAGTEPASDPPPTPTD